MIYRKYQVFGLNQVLDKKWIGPFTIGYLRNSLNINSDISLRFFNI